MVEQDSIKGDKKKETGALAAIAEAAGKMQKAIESVEGVEPKKEKPFETLGTCGKKTGQEPDKVEAKKKWAKNVVKDLEMGEKPPELSLQEKEAQVFQSVIGEKQKNAPWLISEEEFPQSPAAAQIISEIVYSGLENDPDYLLAKAAQLKWTESADESTEIRSERRKIQEKLRVKIKELYREKGAIGDSLKKEQKNFEDVIDHNTSGFESGQTMSGSTSGDWLRVKLPTDASGTEIKINEKIADLIKEIQSEGHTQNWNNINTLYGELGDLREGYFIDEKGVKKDIDITDQEKGYIDRVKEKIKDAFRASPGEKFRPTPYEQDQLTHSAQARDKAFYGLLRKVLHNQDVETHKQLNLYDEVALDNFEEIIMNSVAQNPKTGEWDKEIGSQVVAHYTNLKESILRLSDIDFWARNAAGDVENMTKMTNYFENKFAQEALVDPWVEDMLQCQEQAIKVIRDNNDGYIPQDLTRYNASTHMTYVDQLTLQLFDERMKSGVLRDYARNPETGVPELDPATNGRTFKTVDRPYFYSESPSPDEFTKEIQEEIQLRKLATLRLAKGIGILTNRTIELFAFTRTPGVDTSRRPSGEGAVFSSKAYEGLARWTNPMTDWFLKYKMGGTLAVEFFNVILSQKGGAEGKVFNWSLDQFKKAVNYVTNNEIDRLKDDFGPEAVVLKELVEDFSFSGRFGPLSMWGLIDATLDMKASGYERMGASFRIAFASKKWAGEHVYTEFERQFLNKKWSKMRIKNEWLKASSSPGEWKNRVDDYAAAYKAWIWTDYVMRNPQGAASFLKTGPFEINGETIDRSLRNIILEKIFTIEDLKDFTSEDGQILEKLVVEKDVASLKTVGISQMRLMERIAILDADVSAVMRYAMTADGKPRDIQEEDFNHCIQGDRTFVTTDGKERTVSEERRREQAKDFWKHTQRAVLGKAVGEEGAGWDAKRWRKELRPGGAALGDEKPENVDFNSGKKVFEKAKKENSRAMLNLSVVNERLQIHMGTEDVEWRFLDINTLGDRHWGRRAGDNLTRAKTVNLMIKYLIEQLVGRPKMENLVKALAEIGITESGHDPKEAAKFAAMFAVGTADMYRQSKLAGAPLVGRLASLLGVPMSIAQKNLGVHSADFWSVNNMVKFADMIGETKIISNKSIMNGEYFGPYTMDRLRKDMGASRVLALTEMFVIGYFLAAVATAISAAATSAKEEKS